MLQISVLGSGSSGNSAVVFDGKTRLLIDAGLSARQLRLRLQSVGIVPESLDAILITHEHGDHVRGLDVFCRTLEVPIYTNSMTREVLVSGILKEPKTWRLVNTGGTFSIGNIQVQTFPVAHDATEPMGFTLADSESGIGILSDVGYVTNLMRSHMRGMNTLFVESNYDELLLQNDTKRPWSTKQRILSRHGHLSNDQAGGLIGEMAGPHLTRVILGHLSQDCNESRLAAGVVARRLAECGHPHIEVFCAEQHRPTPCFCAREEGMSLASSTIEEPADADPLEAALRLEEKPANEPAPVGALASYRARGAAARTAEGWPLEQCELF